MNEIIIDAHNAALVETVLPIEDYSKLSEVYQTTHSVAKAFRQWYDNCKAFNKKPKVCVKFSAEKHYLKAAQ